MLGAGDLNRAQDEPVYQQKTRPGQRNHQRIVPDLVKKIASLTKDLWGCFGRQKTRGNRERRWLVAICAFMLINEISMQPQRRILKPVNGLNWYRGKYPVAKRSSLFEGGVPGD